MEGSIMDSINNNYVTAAKFAAAGATVGAAVRGGMTYAAQRSILKNPNEFITKVTGEIATKRGFNTEFFKGTKEAAELANKELDNILKTAVDFAKGGKYDWKAIAKQAGTGALIAGATWAAGYGIYKGIKYLINKGHDAYKADVKDNAKIYAEAMNGKKV